jgi:hypothetical protein
MVFNKQDREEYKKFLNAEIAANKAKAETTEDVREALMLNHYVFNCHRGLSSL